MPRGQYKRPDPIDRFFAKIVELPNGCWQWQGQIKKGYGYFHVGKGRDMLAHRYAYELLVDKIPAGLQTDHLCLNTSCVNPDHLEMVTQQENLRRGYHGGYHKPADRSEPPVPLPDDI